MKLSTALITAAMMISTLGAVGCSAPSALADADQAAEAVASANVPTSEAASYFGRFAFGPRASCAPFVRTRVAFARERFGLGVTPVFVGYAPPAPRYEVIGRAPSAQHLWVNGYQRWTGRDYVWVGGHWDVRRAGFTYVQPHYDQFGGRARFIPGHWV